MKMRLFNASLLALGALSLSAMNASAASMTSVSCSSGSVTAGDSSAIACEGSFEGNDTGAGDPLLTALNDGMFANLVGDLQWDLFGKSDENSSFTADNGLTSGTWSVLEAITGPFVISLKSGTSYSAYLFDGKTPVTSGTFETLGVSVNNKGKAQALSHASLFVAQSNGSTVDVPEPATALALGMFTIGSLGLLKKKRA